MKLRFAALSFAVLLLLACMAGCAASVGKDAADTTMDSGYYYSDNEINGAGVTSDSAPEEAETESDTAGSALASDSILPATGDLSTDRKIIRNAWIELETKEFDASVAELQALVEELGGYISQANVSVYNSRYELHSANYTVRIPAENFDQFLSYRENLGTVSSTNIWTDDVTDSYFDMEARLESLETKRTRLLELLEQAEDMESIIALESALSDTVYEIESLTGSLRLLDNQIAYSTIDVYLNEVRETTEPVALPKTFGERISQQFRDTLQGMADFGENLVIWVVGASPVLVILAVIVALVLVFVKRSAPRRAVRREEKALKNAEAIAQWRASHAQTSAVTQKAAEQKVGEQKASSDEKSDE